MPVQIAKPAAEKSRRALYAIRVCQWPQSKVNSRHSFLARKAAEMRSYAQGRSRMRTLGLLASLALLAVAGGAAKASELVVVELHGLRLAPGQAVDGSKPLSLLDGQTVTLITRDRTDRQARRPLRSGAGQRREGLAQAPTFRPPWPRSSQSAASAPARSGWCAARTELKQRVGGQTLDVRPVDASRIGRGRRTGRARHRRTPGVPAARRGQRPGRRRSRAEPGRGRAARPAASR